MSSTEAATFLPVRVSSWATRSRPSWVDATSHAMMSMRPSVWTYVPTADQNPCSEASEVMELKLTDTSWVRLKAPAPSSWVMNAMLSTVFPWRAESMAERIVSVLAVAAS